jgi:ubiquinone/menaquinone biosynthesis C-methylase UbiE
MSSKKLYSPKKSSRLESKLRKKIQNPKKFLEKYIKKDMKILDFGCGPGIFSIELAKIIGPKGKVIAADLQEEMLNQLRIKLENNPLKKKIRLHKCEKDKINLKEKIDFVFAFYVIHELSNKKSFFDEISKITKKNSKLFIVEPRFHVSKENFEKTIKMAEKAGFKIIEKPKIFLSIAIIMEKL